MTTFLIGEWVWSKTAVTSQPAAPWPIAHALSVEELLVREATDQGLPPHIALNVAWQESRFQEHKVSLTHDYGVMQLNKLFYPTAPQMTTEENVRAGVALLAKYWKQSHDERRTGQAYRYGPQALK